MKGPRSSIGVNLFLWIFGSMAAVFLSFSYISTKRSAEAWESSFEEHAAQTTAVVERVLRQGMLMNNKEAVHAALRDVASTPGITGIRIFDKNGLIRFSTNGRDIETRVKWSAEVCATCHGAPFTTASLESRARPLRAANGSSVMAEARVIKNSDKCAGDTCHPPVSQKPYLGVMDFQMSMAAVDAGNRNAQKSTLQAALVMAVVGGLATFLFIWRFVRMPVLHLVEGTRRVAEGNLDTRIKLGRAKEFHEIARAFNSMTSDLSVARERAQRWEEELAQAVELKTAELGAVQRRMAHIEKMASLGKLAATVAHELNNPLAGILVYAKLLSRELASGQLSDAERDEALRYVEVVRQESARCGEIVKNLLAFARQSKGALGEHGLNEIIERSLMTVQHLLKTNGIERTVELVEGDDRLICDANALQQALVALLVNAVEAMPNGGSVAIRARADAEHLRVSVADTGVGIEPDVLPLIFEPFVSTKGDEKGVGLGLAVVYGIVRRHEAEIDVESSPGKGTTFLLTLPRRLSGSASAEEPVSGEASDNPRQGEASCPTNAMES